MFTPGNLRHASLALFLLIGGAGGSRAVEATPAGPLVLIESFTAGGREQVLNLLPQDADGTTTHKAPLLHSYGAIRLPVSAQALDFRIGPNPQVEEPGRIQFRLEGWDEEWRDMDGYMWLSTRFLDRNGRRISDAALARSGKSPGWTGDPNTSPFRTISESVVTSARSSQLQIFFSSGGGPRATGIWLVKRLRVIATAAGDRPEQVLLDEQVGHGDELDHPRGSPAEWRRDGTNSRAPQVFTFDSSGKGHALALIDNDIRTSGRWSAVGKNIVAVEPGMTIRIETEEAFSIGAGGSYTCSYSRLPAGHYTFRAIPVDGFGSQIGAGVQLRVTLVPPLHATWWFWTIIALVGVTALTGGVRYATWKRMQREIEQSERRHAIERERTRIAQDIHDDMGARLTQISLLSSLALRKTSPDSPTHDELKRMDRAAREVVTALDEIVWAANPAHDTLEGLGNYLSQYVTEAVAASTAHCRLDIPTLLPARFLSSGARHQLLMAVKEALNNAIKHSGATEIRVNLEFEDPLITLTIIDNGRGFDLQQPGSRNGIANMNRRLLSIGGICEIRSAANQGTTVIFAVNLEVESPLP